MYHCQWKELFIPMILWFILYFLLHNFMFPKVLVIYLFINFSFINSYKIPTTNHKKSELSWSNFDWFDSKIDEKKVLDFKVVFICNYCWYKNLTVQNIKKKCLGKIGKCFRLTPVPPILLILECLKFKGINQLSLVWTPEDRLRNEIMGLISLGHWRNFCPCLYGAVKTSPFLRNPA